MLGQPIPYTEAGDRARVRTGRAPGDTGARAVANRGDARGPVVAAPHTEEGWSATIVLDSTGFMVAKGRAGGAQPRLLHARAVLRLGWEAARSDLGARWLSPGTADRLGCAAALAAERQSDARVRRRSCQPQSRSRTADHDDHILVSRPRRHGVATRGQARGSTAPGSGTSTRGQDSIVVMGSVFKRCRQAGSKAHRSSHPATSTGVQMLLTALAVQSR